MSKPSEDKPELHYYKHHCNTWLQHGIYLSEQTSPILHVHPSPLHRKCKNCVVDRLCDILKPALAVFFCPLGTVETSCEHIPDISAPVC